MVHSLRRHGAHLTPEQIQSLAGFLQCVRLGGHHWKDDAKSTCVRCGAEKGGPTLLKLAVEAAKKRRDERNVVDAMKKKV